METELAIWHFVVAGFGFAMFGRLGAMQLIDGAGLGLRP